MRVTTIGLTAVAAVTVALPLLPAFTPRAALACVVGTGASCTEAALDACLPGGGSFDGTVTFNCGGAATITVTSTKTINADTAIDGGSLITISGGNSVGVFSVNTGVNFTVQNLTIANGNSPGSGGGISSGGRVTVMTVTSSTFSGNSAAGSGGGILSEGTLTVTNSTFSGNSADSGGGISNSGTLTVTNTIIANSPSGGNCSGAVTDGGHNIDDGTTCGFTGTGCTSTTGTSFCNTNPQLAAGLANNGGPTQTVALQAGSPAINAGDETICAAPPVNNLDQRGFVRPGTGSVNCSIGSYEFDSPGTPTPTPTFDYEFTPGTPTPTPTFNYEFTPGTPTPTPTFNYEFTPGTPTPTPTFNYELTPSVTPASTPNVCANVTCTALDQCHAAGACDPATGQCSNPPAPSGSTCDDGNPCTQTDQCDGAGDCVGSNPVTCTPLDQCHVAGTCDPGTGACFNPTAADGIPCDAGNACTQPDACLAGICVAAQCVTETVGSTGGTVTTGTTTSPTQPVQTSVTSPTGGGVSITQTAAAGSPPSGFSVVGEQVTISAPAATADAPLVLVFLIDASQIPTGADQNTIQLFKDGVLVPACSGSTGVASPDPCVSGRQLLSGGDVQITVLTSTASLWAFAVVTCRSGTDCDDGNPCTTDSCDPVAGCRHSTTCQNDLIPGGGSVKTDCTHEWLTDPSPGLNRRGLPAKRLDCTDDDPSCDFGTATGACTFHVAMCFNATEQRSACTPSDVRQVKLVQPGTKPRDPIDAANRAALEDALVQLGGDVQGLCTQPRAKHGLSCAANSDCDSAPGKGDGTCPRAVNFASLNAPYVCTRFAEITVPLQQTAPGSRAGVKTLQLIATPSGGRLLQDRDSLTLVCKPKP